jgi:hypothetical protein
VESTHAAGSIAIHGIAELIYEAVFSQFVRVYTVRVY